MKNPITRFAFVITAFVALSFLMGYSVKPSSDNVQEYMVVSATGPSIKIQMENLQREVNQKISEGWRLQGGLAAENGGVMFQALVK